MINFNADASEEFSQALYGNYGQICFAFLYHLQYKMPEPNLS